MPDHYPTFRRVSERIAKWPFFYIAAWYSLIAPFVAGGFAFLTIRLGGPYDRNNTVLFSYTSQDLAVTTALFICLSSLVLGIISLSGIEKYGLNAILWKALIGILASCFFGWCCLMILYAFGIRC
jgi:hypothetical protein